MDKVGVNPADAELVEAQLLREVRAGVVVAQHRARRRHHDRAVAQRRVGGAAAQHQPRELLRLRDVGAGHQPHARPRFPLCAIALPS